MIRARSACIGVTDRDCVDVCPVQCIYEFDESTSTFVSDVETGKRQVRLATNPTPARLARAIPRNTYTEHRPPDQSMNRIQANVMTPVHRADRRDVLIS